MKTQSKMGAKFLFFLASVYLINQLNYFALDAVHNSGIIFPICYQATSNLYEVNYIELKGSIPCLKVILWQI